MGFIDHLENSENARGFLRENPDCQPVNPTSTGCPRFTIGVLKRYLAWLFENRDTSFDMTVGVSQVMEDAIRCLEGRGEADEGGALSLVDDIAEAG